MCKALLASVILSVISGCASQATTPQNTAPKADPTEVTVETRPFELETLYSLLVADVAAQRNRLDVTLRNYLDQSISTKDPNVAKHTTLLAEALRAESIAQKTALIWSNGDPKDWGALYSSAIHQARAKQYNDAMQRMQQSLEAGGKSNFNLIAGLSRSATRTTQLEILQRLLSLQDKNPGNEDVLLAVANMQHSLAQRSDALATTRQLLKTSPDHLTGLNMEARLLQELDRHDEAFLNYEDALKRDPDNKRLRLHYAKLLSGSDMNAAQTQFKKLVELNPNDNELQFTLALVYRENKQLDAAENLLNELALKDPLNPGVNFYLGLINEEKEQNELAIDYYSKVAPSKVFTKAQARYADMSAEAGRLDSAIAHLKSLRTTYPSQYSALTLISADALTRSGHLQRSHQLLSDALTKHPEDRDLLYTRSMLNEKRNDLDGMEKDLRTMLAIDPNNVTALNALGYTLTIHTSRLDEAYELIKRAYALQPNDPAIMDSMGWIEYRRGELENALQLLAQAHARFPDPEVSAHYGEVLWQSGNKVEAKKIWQAILDKHPDSDIMKDIIERFGQP